MRKTILLVTLTAAGLGVIGPRLYLAAQRVYAAAVRQPYTAVLSERTYDAKGNEMSDLRRSKVLAVRRDSSRVELVRTPESRVPGGAIEWRLIWDRQTDRQTGIYPLLGKTVTFPIRTHAPEPRPDCMTDDVAGGTKGEEWLLGLRTIHLSHTAVFENGDVMDRIDYWRSPELGCLTLQKVVDHQVLSTSERSRTVERADSVVRGEPDARLFTIPNGLKEAKSSEILEDTARLTGSAMKDCDRATGSRADAGYESSRKQAGW